MIRLNSLWEFYCLFFCRSIYQPIWYSSLPLFTCMAAILDNNNNNKKILSIYSVKYLTHFSKDSHNSFFSLSLSSSKLFIFFQLKYQRNVLWPYFSSSYVNNNLNTEQFYCIPTVMYNFFSSHIQKKNTWNISITQIFLK